MEPQAGRGRLHLTLGVGERLTIGEGADAVIITIGRRAGAGARVLIEAPRDHPIGRSLKMPVPA